MSDRQIALLPCALPRIGGSWGEPKRAYEQGPMLHKVYAATPMAVLNAYGLTEDEAGRNWNEMQVRVHDQI